MPRGVLVGLLAELMNVGQGSFAWGFAGRVLHRDGIEYLFPKWSMEMPPRSDNGYKHAALFILAVQTGQEQPNQFDWAEEIFTNAGIPVHAEVGVLSLTTTGLTQGAVRLGGRWSAINEFALPGEDMVSTSIQKVEFSTRQAIVEGRYSRIAGALGVDEYARLTGLRYAIVGTSRTGTLVAHSLARLGVRSICMVDPDTVEPHNADAGEFDPHLDEGSNKAMATARHIGRIMAPGCVLEPYALPIQSALALNAVRESDVIISTVDDDGARLAAAVLATAFLRVHLDIGTQLKRGPLGEIVVGADIRLLAPDSEPRCLCCYGGFADHDSLKRAIGIGNPPPRLHWSETRAGSLRSVNQIAAHIGLRMLERLVTGEGRSYSWFRYSESPLPSISELNPVNHFQCPLCKASIGIGDTVFSNWDQRLRRVVRATLDQASESSARHTENNGA